MTNYNNLIALTTFIILSSTHSHAAFYYNDLYTDSNGNFPNASAGWIGDGAIQPNVSSPPPLPGDPPLSVTLDQPLISGFSAGTLILGETQGFIGRNGINTGITGSMNIILGGGGTADMNVDRAFAVQGLGVNNFGIYNLLGVNSLTVELSWDSPISAIDGFSPFFGPTYMGDPTANAAPLLAAFQGQGTGLTQYNINLEYLGLIHTTDGTNFNAGLPSNTNAFDMTDSALTFADGAGSASVTGTTLANNVWHGVNGFDITPENDYSLGVQNNSIITDQEAVYASGMRFTISRTDGMDFAGTSQFVFSSNGNQWGDTVNGAINFVPEPSTSLLIGLGVMFLFKRSRL